MVLVLVLGECDCLGERLRADGTLVNWRAEGIVGSDGGEVESVGSKGSTRCVRHIVGGGGESVVSELNAILRCFLYIFASWHGCRSKPQCGIRVHSS